MRGASTVASSLVMRTIAAANCTAAIGGEASSAVVRGRLFQASLSRSVAISSSYWRWFPLCSSSSSRRGAVLCFVGTLASVAGAGLFFEEVHAKELTPPALLPREVVLYQYEACPFCNKVKAFLDYYHIPYEVVEVNPLSKQQIKWSDYKKVPILMVDGESLVDSSVIIDQLYKKICPTRSAGDDDNEEYQWRKWVDNHLVHVLSLNIYRNTYEALEAFNYITKKDDKKLSSSEGSSIVCFKLSSRQPQGVHFKELVVHPTWTPILLGGAPVVIMPQTSSPGAFYMFQKLLHLSRG